MSILNTLASKKLLSADYFNYLEEEEDIGQFSKIDDELYYFKIIFDELKELQESEDEEKTFNNLVLELSNYLVKIFNCDELRFMIDKDSKHFKQIIQFFKDSFNKLNYQDIESKINMLKLSAFLLNEELKKDIKKYTPPDTINTNDKEAEQIAQEVNKIKKVDSINQDNLTKDLNSIKLVFKDFKEWLDSSNLKASELNNLHSIEVLYKIFKNTYKPKRKKIFLSMPFDRETELTYHIVKDCIDELNEELKYTKNDKLELIRIDKTIYPTSDFIPKKVYEEIEDCTLMIADLTGNNRNVYNEIGYKTALDKNLKEPQIILIHNTASYYDENAKKYKMGHLKEEEKDEDVKKEEDYYKVKIKEIKEIEVGFNISAIAQIRFKDENGLKDILKGKLNKYYKDYQVRKTK